MITLKQFQTQAVENIIELFDAAHRQLREIHDPLGRRSIISHNGCVLLQAPTGSGKTLMAGTVAERFSQGRPVIWLWFTPFGGLVDQARETLNVDFPALRVLNVRTERKLDTLRSGDVYITTWASVAARSKESRKLRMDTENELSLDHLIDEAHGLGFQIGVIVDEAHHGFKASTEAVRFYKEVLKPEFTLLITATPNDKDAELFKNAVGFQHMHRVTVSRQDAVEAGLIKRGVKSIAYMVDESQKNLGDFIRASLREGWILHQNVKDLLEKSGITLTPLMLVQVNDDSKGNDSVQEARRILLELGVPEEAIAMYTSTEPSDALINVAQDEGYEVLIFKVAAALGFDAPRAFTLVSLRRGKSADFGIQVVGRILRVHRRIQGKPVDERLLYGYAVLADAANQEGLTAAAERINAIKTGFAAIAPYTMIVRTASEPEVQVVRKDSQAQLFYKPQLDDTHNPESFEQNIHLNSPGEYAGTATVLSEQRGEQFKLSSELFAEPNQALTEPNINSKNHKSAVELPTYRYSLIKEAPSRFKTERIPATIKDILKCLGQQLRLDPSVLQDGLRDFVPAVRIERDIFSEGEADRQETIIPLSDGEIARQAQRLLLEPGTMNPGDVRALLLDRLRQEYKRVGHAIAVDEVALKKALNKILVLHPALIPVASQRCYSSYAEEYDTAALPPVIESDTPLPRSDRNIYGAIPPGLNEDERAFVRLLDNDYSDTVEWWHRNEVNKPHSVALVLRTGGRYFPDFIVKVKEREQGGGLVLVEIKGGHLLNYEDTHNKLLARHRTYLNPLILTRESNGRWMTITYREKTGKAAKDRIFNIDVLESHLVSTA